MNQATGEPTEDQGNKSARTGAERCRLGEILDGDDGGDHPRPRHALIRENPVVQLGLGRGALGRSDLCAPTSRTQPGDAAEHRRLASSTTSAYQPFDSSGFRGESAEPRFVVFAAKPANPVAFSDSGGLGAAPSLRPRRLSFRTTSTVSLPAGCAGKFVESRTVVAYSGGEVVVDVRLIAPRVAQGVALQVRRLDYHSREATGRRARSFGFQSAVTSADGTERWEEDDAWTWLRHPVSWP